MTSRRGFLKQLGGAVLAAAAVPLISTRSMARETRPSRPEVSAAELTAFRKKSTRMISVEPGQRIQDVLDSLPQEDRVIIVVPPGRYEHDSLVVTCGGNVKIVTMYGGSAPVIELTRAIEAKHTRLYVSGMHFHIGPDFEDSAVIDSRKFDAWSWDHLEFRENVILGE